MKTKPICFLFFSILPFLSWSQEANLETETVKKWNYEPNFTVGFDVINAGISFFQDRKLYQGFVSSKIKDNIHAAAEAGFESNIYNKNGYDATVNGPFVKIGGFYMLVKDQENELNGFYGGAKLAAAFYEQQYSAIPVRGYGGSGATVSLPTSSQSSFWIEGNLGGRVQLFTSDFYIDVNIQPKYLAYTSKQEEVVPMIVPGFGRSSSKFNLGFSWNIAYRF